MAWRPLLLALVLATGCADKKPVGQESDTRVAAWAELSVDLWLRLTPGEQTQTIQASTRRGPGSG
jgi:hypothetical protein